MCSFLTHAFCLSPLCILRTYHTYAYVLYYIGKYVCDGDATPDNRYRYAAPPASSPADETTTSQEQDV